MNIIFNNIIFNTSHMNTYPVKLVDETKYKIARLCCIIRYKDNALVDSIVDLILLIAINIVEGRDSRLDDKFLGGGYSLFPDIIKNIWNTGVKYSYFVLRDRAIYNNIVSIINIKKFYILGGK